MKKYFPYYIEILDNELKLVLLIYIFSLILIQTSLINYFIV